ncbi:hypothetical protein HQ42_07850 [Porphyromonas gulae]|nr:hypothetical protein HQ42_07850 [Porphyromonas gulae]
MGEEFGTMSFVGQERDALLLLYYCYFALTVKVIETMAAVVFLQWPIQIICINVNADEALLISDKLICSIS